MGAEDVGIIGAGIHPFGRHPGVTGLQMAVAAARAALADAGVSWPEIDFAVGGSEAAGNADTSVAMLGLTGVPFVNVRNGCAPGPRTSPWWWASTSTRRERSIRSRRTGGSAAGTARPA